MQDFYTLEVAGLTRQLPICQADEHMSIAAFVMFSDVELTVVCAKELIKKCPEHDVIVTAETKGIPLAYEMARNLDERYIVARKSVKLYMKDPISVKVKSITTDHIQTLYLAGSEVDYLKGKRVLIVDDVISTGESLAAMEELIHTSGGTVAGKAAVLAEGDAAKRGDIIYLEYLPLFFD
ncbi:phosphoribosyltransferase family protein [Candidatus Soleaferrea massiliensis]|uniref:phosphoribosyltransferase family protein n=1 Tax=Candidatus Soleaferrea massiliensis TaxID=1470354 RepID=UPI00058BB0FA|nr:phosphoribosyltransferase family protein [Candidatus Soleaferrea massiliensis]